MPLEHGVWEGERNCSMVLQRDKIQPCPCSEKPTVHILHSLQDQTHAWMLPELSLRWMFPQLPVLQEDTRTQLPSHLSLYMPNPGGGGTMEIMPNPTVLPLLEGKRSWTESGDKYSSTTWPCCTPGEDLLHYAWS